MLINSKHELEVLFSNNPCKEELSEECYAKTRYIDQLVFDNLLKYELNFEPFVRMAEQCSMDHIPVMKSTETNRFYIGFVNLGGHRAMFEVRPVRLAHVLNTEYIERMYAAYGYEFGLKVDNQQTYEI